MCAAGATASRAQTFKTLLNFNGTDGKYPAASLVQGFDGNFYGTTFEGGAHGLGTAFKMTPGGKLITFYSFCGETGCGPDGAYPEAGLAQATNGNLYGTTYGGGANGNFGTVFQITAGGKLTTLYSFCSQRGCADGYNPVAGLVQAADGSLYGTASQGGANGRGGTVFKITPAGKLTTLYSFCFQTNCRDGAQPMAGLVQATNGNFYGTTYGGGAYGIGTVFQITTGGKLTTLHSFDGTDGERPEAGLVQAINGNLYGTTISGGAKNDGTVIEITAGGKVTILHSFDGADGARPYAGLVQVTDGNFYGTTTYGGVHECSGLGCGTVFKMTPAGKLATLHSFAGTDGDSPGAGLLQATNGNFYGTTYYVGASGNGTAFSLSVGLGPFVETLPTSGSVGMAAIILGNNLTGATSVTFNGAVATFTVVSSSEIKTTVPKGATTGKVQVKTPHGTLTSNAAFRVK
jgi:uncharacterized repeat protein (TIGR03803 family)